MENGDVSAPGEHPSGRGVMFLSNCGTSLSRTFASASDTWNVCCQFPKV